MLEIFRIMGFSHDYKKSNRARCRRSDNGNQGHGKDAQ
ncbi:MAG: hypothetical protein ACJAXW_004370 [Candidatus Azotimanducaceae bacterium]|jgi:hypothetical protein